MLDRSISAPNVNPQISRWRALFTYGVHHSLPLSPVAPRMCPFVYGDCMSRCKNCLIHLSRDVHVDLTSVKRRFPHEDISKHTFEIEFVDRSSSDVSIFCNSSERVPSTEGACFIGADQLVLTASGMSTHPGFASPSYDSTRSHRIERCCVR